MIDVNKEAMWVEERLQWWNERWRMDTT